MDEFETELRNIFFQEASENLEEVEAAYLQFNEALSVELIEKSFRLTHNLKGSSKAVGFAEASDLLHHIENVLTALKKKTIVCTQSISTTLLQANDAVKILLYNLKQDDSYKTDLTKILDKIDSILKNPQPALEQKPIIEQKPENLAEEKSKQVPTAPSVEYELFTDVPVIKTKPKPSVKKEAEEIQSAPVKTTKAAPQNENAKEITDEFIRVPLKKIAMLQNYIGEMVILESILKEHLKLDSSKKLKNLFRQLDKNTKEVQETVMGLRLVSVKPIFQKLSRTTRDTSSQLNKKIRVEFVGENLEIDKFILDQISDPLMHMVRNAIDHGIEEGAERLANNKPQEGVVLVQIENEGGSLIIRIEDDGKGLDPKFLYEKAISKGFISRSKVLTDEQCFRLIFTSGFSTKQEATDISGRGVGMDVVKTNIEALGGKINIQSEIGKGTKFKITLPLSIGIMSAFVVEVAERKYVIPLHKVKEALNLKNSSIKNIPEIGNVVILRSEEIPVYDLALGLNIKKNENANVDEKVILIMEESNNKMGVILDKILNIQSVVTKNLGEELRCQSGIIGSVILGDGSVVPILEIPALIQGDHFSQNIQRMQNKVMI